MVRVWYIYFFFSKLHHPPQRYLNFEKAGFFSALDFVSFGNMFCLKTTPNTLVSN